MGWWGRRKAARLAEREVFRARRRFLREDVTDFGEQLGDLHVETLTASLDAEGQAVYRHALQSYERAKAALDAADDAAGLEPVVTALVEGRFQRACVLAAATGAPPPQRLPECFFNPQHGPSTTEVSWTPPGGTPRRVAVCGADASRLAAGEEPAVRMVRVGDRWLPHFGGHRASYVPAMVDAHAIDVGVGITRGRAAQHGSLSNHQIDNIGYHGFGGG